MEARSDLNRIGDGEIDLTLLCKELNKNLLLFRHGALHMWVCPNGDSNGTNVNVLKPSKIV